MLLHGQQLQWISLSFLLGVPISLFFNTPVPQWMTRTVSTLLDFQLLVFLTTLATAWSIN